MGTGIFIYYFKIKVEYLLKQKKKEDVIHKHLFIFFKGKNVPVIYIIYSRISKDLRIVHVPDCIGNLKWADTFKIFMEHLLYPLVIHLWELY